jgi:magnesium and cobalt exporter, CNNM family
MMMFTHPLLALTPIITSGDASGGSVGALIFFIFLAIGTSFLCSLLEAVLLSSNVSHIESLVQQGKGSGILMQQLKLNVERPISAILTLNTVAHTVGATLAGAEAAAIVGSDYVGIISALLTLLVLVFSEVLPKTVGAVYWKQLTPFTAYTIRILMIVLYPAVWIFERLTRSLRPEGHAPTVTRSDLEVLAKISQQEGALLERENRILRNLLHLNSVKVYDIMTPRTVVMALNQDMTVVEALHAQATLPYSRIPIYNENIDNVIGYVLRHDIVNQVASDKYDVKLKELCREIHAIPETITVAQVLDEFIAEKEHIFLVLDEYGGTAGILTMEDAFESLLGIEITDESDLVADLRQLAQQRYQRKFATTEIQAPREQSDQKSAE